MLLKDVKELEFQCHHEMDYKIENQHSVWPRNSMYYTQGDAYKKFISALFIISKTINNQNIIN